MTSCSLAQTTVESAKVARRLAEGAVAKRLAACVQIEGPITSVYHWQGTLESAFEWRITFKTLPGRQDALERWVLDSHPYETPEWISWPAHTSPAYGKWLETEAAE